MIGLAHRVRGTVTVVTPEGFRLRIPPWMLKPEAAQPRVLAQAVLSVTPLLALAEFVQSLSLPKESILKLGENSRKEESIAATSTTRGRTAGPARAAAAPRVAVRAGADDGNGRSSGFPRRSR